MLGFQAHVLLSLRAGRQGMGNPFSGLKKKLWSKFSLKKIVEVQISPHTPKSVQFTCTARFCFRKYLEIISS
jgi:hypothetical protein